MQGQLGVEAGARPAESVGMMACEAELRSQLVVDRLNALARAVEQPYRRGGQPAPLVVPQDDQQGHGTRGTLLARSRCADVALIADDGQVRLLAQQIGPPPPRRSHWPVPTRSRRRLR